MITSRNPTARTRTRLAVIAAGGLFAFALYGCDSKEDAPPPASPASTAPASPAPSSSAPSSSSTPSSATQAAPSPTGSSTTPGTPEGAANTLPPSDSIGKSEPAAQTATDAKSTDPRGENTKAEETVGQPEALQSNNHSSPALDKEAK